MKQTKTIYYAFVQKLEVPENLTDGEIDRLVFESIEPGADYMWSEKSDLFELDHFTQYIYKKTWHKSGLFVYIIK